MVKVAVFVGVLVIVGEFVIVGVVVGVRVGDDVAVRVGVLVGVFTVVLKVVVTDWAALPIEKLHTFPAQPVMPALWPLQLTNTDPTSAVAVNVPMSLFPRATVHVALHIVLSPGVVLSVTVTVPVPVPAKVMVRFLAASAG